MEENITKLSEHIEVNSILQIAVFGAEIIQPIKSEKADIFFLFSIEDVIAEVENLDFVVINSPSKSVEIFAFLEDRNVPFIKIEDKVDNSIIELLVSDISKCTELGLSYSDFAHIHSHGVAVDAIATHMSFFKNGLKKKALQRAAIDGDGILKLDEHQIRSWANHFDSQKENQTCQKFVPASGAASRMFSFLSKFLTDFNPESDSIAEYIQQNNADELQNFIENYTRFPFFDDVDKTAKKENGNFENCSESQKQYNFIEVMLNENQLNFGNKPKGVLPFHKYKSAVATPIDEHIKEAFEYANSRDQANLHFTVTEEHRSMFEEIVKNFAHENDCKLAIDYSYQDKSTDTIAVDLDNKPFRNGNNQLLFRPSGHGALISNLDKLNADIIFIKNIDNVSCGDTKKVALYKKALAGILLELQAKIFEILIQIENDKFTSDLIPNIVSFLENDLNIHLPKSFSEMNFTDQKNTIAELLSRPIRVCGMVKNQGEAGGGPFWIQDDHGVSLQIVETSQIDLDNPKQAGILKSATHFNPVDLVCGIKNHKGEKYNLHYFVNHKSGFIVQKNHEGHNIKAYELPGLWNGAMARWISVFVEVPLCTFNPVKTVNDLLKPAHQPQ